MTNRALFVLLLVTTFGASISAFGAPFDVSLAVGAAVGLSFMASEPR